MRLNRIRTNNIVYRTSYNAAYDKISVLLHTQKKNKKYGNL
jgi:hypothetical protein